MCIYIITTGAMSSIDIVSEEFFYFILEHFSGESTVFQMGRRRNFFWTKPIFAQICMKLKKVPKGGRTSGLPPVWIHQCILLLQPLTAWVLTFWITM